MGWDKQGRVSAIGLDREGKEPVFRADSGNFRAVQFRSAGANGALNNWVVPVDTVALTRLGKDSPVAQQYLQLRQEQATQRAWLYRAIRNLTPNRAVYDRAWH